ncbi:hypothetical protein X801_04912 [Opisthorchis viverrini]|uniref:Uncharacterized protein n=1 Tax=Opisthorchis viverrini TaxID=6198 RepID=A0A1S8WXV8_OPIVI|nr:hypothetical protein X801_04912 [Opisthorchis viverrini]
MTWNFRLRQEQKEKILLELEYAVLLNIRAIVTEKLSYSNMSVTDKVFLEFFFARLRPNTTGRYDDEFPYLSLCGRERNFVRCDDRPIVFLDLVERAEISHWLLTFGFAQSSKLSVPFQPQHLYMNPKSGRIYHPAVDFDDPEKNTVHESLVVGLMCSDLALRLADMFQWTQLNHVDTGAPPDYFLWEQTVYKLSNALSPYITSLRSIPPHGNPETLANDLDRIVQEAIISTAFIRKFLSLTILVE